MKKSLRRMPFSFQLKNKHRQRSSKCHNTLVERYRDMYSSKNKLSVSCLKAGMKQMMRNDDQVQDTFGEWPRYTIAIRTLGTAGNKFLAQLDSLHRLVPAPESINVYIPYGYAKPEIPYDDVRFFRCDKGMVAQRALQFDEINTEWILFLDDDIVLPVDGVARLFKVAEDMSADCISADHEFAGGVVNVLKRCGMVAAQGYKCGIQGRHEWRIYVFDASGTQGYGIRMPLRRVFPR